MNVSHTVSCMMTSVKRHDYPITRGGLRPFVVYRLSICYILQGSGTMLVEDAEYEIKPGGCFLLSSPMKVEDPERLLVVWSDPEAVEKLNDDRLWEELRAVKERQVYVPDSVEWDAWGPLGRECTIRACVDYFAKLV